MAATIATAGKRVFSDHTWPRALQQLLPLPQRKFWQTDAASLAQTTALDSPCGCNKATFHGTDVGQNLSPQYGGLLCPYGKGSTLPTGAAWAESSSSTSHCHHSPELVFSICLGSGS